MNYTTIEKDYKLNYKINEYLSVRLKDDHVEIYVGDDWVRQCHLLIMNIPSKKADKLERIDSVDELVEYAEEKWFTQEQIIEDMWNNEEIHEKAQKVTPEEELWAHASTLQVWAEMDYDTTLLDMRLAFPILKELRKIGDPTARKTFKNEIFKRMKSNFPPVLIFLSKEGFLDLLTEEEQQTLFQEINLRELLKVFSKAENEKYNHIAYFLENLSEEQINMFLVESDSNDITQLELVNVGITSFPEPLFQYTDLKVLNLSKNFLQNLPVEIELLKNLEYLELNKNKLSKLPKSTGNLKKLEFLDIRNNNLTELQEVIGNLNNLKRLRIRGNKLKSLPNSIKNLKKLENLDLGENKFSEFPLVLIGLKGLKGLSLNHNDIKEFPSQLGNLTALIGLDLSHNKLETLPQSIGRLKSLENLNLNHNNLKELTNSIRELKLKRLSLKSNNLKTIPNSLLSLIYLEELDLSYNPLQNVPNKIFELPNLEILRLPYQFLTPESFLHKFNKYIESSNDILYIKK